MRDSEPLFDGDVTDFQRYILSGLCLSWLWSYLSKVILRDNEVLTTSLSS